MDLSTLNTHICEILDRHGLGSAADVDEHRLYGTPDDTPVYGELVEYFASSYSDILQVVDTQISSFQRIEFSEHIEIDLQMKLCLLLGKVPFLQPPPLRRHDDRLDTIEVGDSAFTSIFQITDSFILFCATHRPLMDMSRILILPRGFGWRLPLKHEVSAVNATLYASESLGRFPEGGLGALLDSLEATGVVEANLLKPSFSRMSCQVSDLSWSSFVHGLPNTTVCPETPFAVPIPSSLNVLQLNKLITEEPEAFVRCTRAFQRFLNESVGRLEVAKAGDLLQQCFAEVVQPELAKIEQLYHRYHRVHAIKVGATALATLPLAASTLALPETIDLLAKTIGTGGIITLLGKVYADYLNDMSKLKESPWYFIWKLHKKHKK